MRKPKYRNLSILELQEFEKEFIEFLVINGVQPDEWERLKGSEEGDGIIVSFSDVIFESIMRKTQYLEQWTSRDIKTFQCLPDKMVLVGAELKTGIDLDLLQASSRDLVQNFRHFEFCQTEKPYAGNREAVIFGMVNAGCTISDGQLFKKMALAMVD